MIIWMPWRCDKMGGISQALKYPLFQGKMSMQENLSLGQ